MLNFWKDAAKTGDLQKIHLLTAQMRQQLQNCGNISVCVDAYTIS
ncbi:DUF1843 domain-containing protein [Blautia intestinalis]